VSSPTLENAMVRPMGREPDPALLRYSRIAIDDNTLRSIFARPTWLKLTPLYPH
jgi:hypothetical protein